jgi:O-methyltransferase
MTRRWRVRERGNRDEGGSAPAESPVLAHADAADRAIVERAMPYTMTGAARMLALVDAVRYCVSREIPGAFAECGVWRGGSVMTMILTLQDLSLDDRDIYLYDTFEGMTEPTEHDTSSHEGPAVDTWRAAREGSERPWAEVFGADVFNEDSVRGLLQSTGYPTERLHFVRGPVEQTIPGSLAEQLALLRLDTDWYESTRHELEHMFPRLEQGGVLIIDDYGHWDGARRAVDEYFGASHPPLLLSRIDYTARIAVKV